MQVEDLDQRIPQVLEQMPAIGHLHSIRRTLSGPLGIRPGPIPTDDLNSWMLLEPVGKRCGGAIRQEIDHGAALDVDEDRPIGVPFAARPIIDAQNTWRRWIARWGAANQADERVTTGGVIQLIAEALAGRTTERDADRPLLLRHASGASGPRHRDLREAFGKNGPQTVRSRTEAFAHMQLEPDGHIRPRQIEQRTRIGAMDTPRGGLTARTGRCRLGRGDFQNQHLRGLVQRDSVQAEIGDTRQEAARSHS
jgi:hypothetical protein